MKLKKLLAIILTFIMCFGVLNFAFADEAEEIPEGYIPIYIAEDLNNIRNDLDGKYILMNDIDLSAYENWVPIGTKDDPFAGEINGNGYQIKNLIISVNTIEPGTHYYGLFGYAKSSTIDNVIVIDADISVIYSGTENATCFTGTIAGYGYESVVTNSAVSGKTYAEGFYSMAAGGFIGKNRNIKMPDSFAGCVNYSDINVKATALSKYVYVGGIAGSALGFKNECCNFGKINVEGENVASFCEVMLGGIDGNGSEGGFLNNSYNRGDVAIDFSTSETYVGGLSGVSFTTTNSYNCGSVTLPRDFSGCVGAISGSIGAGGMYIQSPYVENVYYSETDLIVGYADCVHPDDVYEDRFDFIYINFAELSDEEMKKQESFAGFDFEKIWEMEENGYPVLKNQPKIIVKESIELELGKVYMAKPGVRYHTTNEAVAKTDIDGRIIAEGVGTAVVTVDYEYGYRVEYNVSVIGGVKEPVEPDYPCFIKFILVLWNYLKESAFKVIAWLKTL